MNAQKIAYIIDANLHREDFKKGFLNKGLFALSGAVKNPSLVWKASELYDGGLNEAGIVVACADVGAQSEKTAEAVSKLCEKHNINLIACGEADVLGECGFGPRLRAFTCDSHNFIKGFAEVFEKEKITENTQTALVVCKEKDIAYAKYIAQKMNYITLYSVKRELAPRMADALYGYNGTACRVAKNAAELKDCSFAVVTDKSGEYMTERILRTAEVLRPYVKTNINESQLFYTDKLGVLSMDASFPAARYYLKFGKTIESDFGAFCENELSFSKA